MTTQSAARVSTAAPAKKLGGNSKKSAAGRPVAAPTSLDGVMSLIQEAALTRDDTQMLVEMILAGSSEDSWTTKVRLSRYIDLKFNGVLAFYVLLYHACIGIVHTYNTSLHACL